MRRLPASFLPLVAIATLGAGALGLAGCGSDDDEGATTESSLGPDGESGEYEIVDDATVTAGLTKLPATIESAIAAIGTPDADAALDEIQAEWFSFEGTIREKDRETYLAIEDQLSPLQEQIEEGDAEAASVTASTLNTLFDQYLAKFP